MSFRSSGLLLDPNDRPAPSYQDFLYICAHGEAPQTMRGCFVAASGCLVLDLCKVFYGDPESGNGDLQVVVSPGSGQWDQLFGGGKSPAFAGAAVAAFASGLVSILAIPRSGAQKLRALT